MRRANPVTSELRWGCCRDPAPVQLPVGFRSDQHPALARKSHRQAATVCNSNPVDSSPGLTRSGMGGILEPRYLERQLFSTEPSVMQFTLQIPDDLAAQLRPRRQRLPHILSLGLRELDAQGAAGFSGLADVLELLASLPTPEQIMALRPSQPLQTQIDHLLERSREGGLTDEEEQQWRNYQYIEHLVRKSKIRAAQRLRQA